ncbi:uncharacterized protein [Diadema antillarum]|uniref:uncharacterized protein n=1 Tax=Diadema antillarum TaxID=105358 RepID=UPI003A866641
MRQPVILDIGSRSSKVGFGDIHKQHPDVIFDTGEVFSDRSPAAGVPMVEDGIVTNWDQYTMVACHALEHKLAIDPGTDHPLFLVEKPNLEIKVRQNLVQFAFEQLAVPEFYLASEPLMALYSVGLASGIVLSSGHSSSWVSTVHEGHMPPYGYVNLNFGGQALTEYTKKLLCTELNQKVDDTEAEEIKCKYGRVQTAPLKSDTSDFKKEESIGQQLGEMLFHPGKCCKGFHTGVERSVYLTDEEDEYEPVYFRHVMLCGGTTMLPGLMERLAWEIKPPDYLSCGVRIIAPPFRRNAGWIGGSLAACLPTFRHHWITKEDYAEFGENILWRKCLSY